MQKILWPLPRRLASCKPSTPLFGWHAACTFLIAVAYSIAVAVEPPTFPKPTFMRHLGCTSSIRCQRAPALPSKVPLSAQYSLPRERRGGEFFMLLPALPHATSVGKIPPCFRRCVSVGYHLHTCKGVTTAAVSTPRPKSAFYLHDTPRLWHFKHLIDPIRHRKSLRPPKPFPGYR